MTEQQERPRVVVGVIMYRENGDIFLFRSHKWKGLWVIPGGHIEFGESMADAVRREMKEETSIDVDSIKFLEVQEGIFPPEFEEKRHFIYLHFAAHALSDKVILNDEAEEYVWVEPRKALEMDLVPSVRPFMEMYLRNAAVRS